MATSRRRSCPRATARLFGRKKAAVSRAINAMPASVHLVPLDFERDDLFGTLTEHGYHNDDRTFFTYVRSDFIDGRNMYGATLLYKRFRQRQQVWKFGLDPGAVEAFVGEYGWRLVENAGSDYYLQNYIRPAGRDLAASDLE